MDDVAPNLRQRIVEFLELSASKEDQLEYQATAPHIGVANEIFNQWDDWYYPDDEGFCSAFSAEELAHLQEFNSVFEDVCAMTPQTLPRIEEFVATDAWMRYNEAAKRALVAIGGP